MFTPGEINVICTDARRSLAFYRGVLGFTIIGREEAAVRVRCGGSVFLLLPVAAERDSAPYCRRAAFSIDLMTRDLAGAARRLRARRVKFARPYRPGARSIIVRDPDGLVIEIIQAKPTAKAHRL